MRHELKDNKAYQLLEKKNKIYSAYVDMLEKHITPILEEISTTFVNYTSHNIDHSLNVLHYMCEIAGDSIDKLNDLELLVIIYSAILHDVGMFVKDSEKQSFKESDDYNIYMKKNSDNESDAIQDFFRERHGIRAYEYILNDNEISRFFITDVLSDVNFKEVVAKICQSHQEGMEWIKSMLQEESYYGNCCLNAQYIALLLRIADYLDFDSERAPDYLFQKKEIKNIISQREWKKHGVISNKTKINENREIFFFGHCNEYDLYIEIDNMLEKISDVVKSCVLYSKKFQNNNYHLNIAVNVKNNIESDIFFEEKFQLSMDYEPIYDLLMGVYLYKDKKIGLREIMQNAFDACDMMKSYLNKNEPGVDYNPVIQIIFKKEGGKNSEVTKVIVKDNGIGMKEQTVKDYLFKIGSSYYKSDEYKKYGFDDHPTGTFGIGFLSSFMLSNEVTVRTRHQSESETLSYRAFRDTKHIYKLKKEERKIETHGTEIEMSYDTFREVFNDNDAIKNYLRENFYLLSKYQIIIMNDNNIEVSLNDVIQKKSNKSVDLSEYLNLIECKASISTFTEDIKLYSSFRYVEDDIYKTVILTRNGINLYQILSVRNEQPCICVKNVYAFEQLLFQYYDNYYEEDADLFIEKFEKYGFEMFKDDFNEYYADENDIFSNNYDYDKKICVIWDDTITDNEIRVLLEKAEKRHLIDNDIINTNESFMEYEEYNTFDAKEKKDLMEDFNCGYCFHLFSSHFYYRNVLLENSSLRGKIAKLIFESHVVININNENFVPSVTRKDMTDEQLDKISYAVLRALHLHLLERYKEKQYLYVLIEDFVNKHYSVTNEFCCPYIENNS